MDRRGKNAGDGLEDAKNETNNKGRDNTSAKLTVHDDVRDKVLEKRSSDLETSLQNLATENEKLQIKLANEKHRSHKFQKKLQYICDNEQIFSRLKQTYLKMKYNESVGKPSAEIKESSCQTWEGIMCGSCQKTAEYGENHTSKNERMPIKRADLANLQQTVQTLKYMVNRREQSWSYNMDRELQYKHEVWALKQENTKLRELIKSMNMNIEALPSNREEKPETPNKDRIFKKIIVKLMRRHRELVKMHQLDDGSPLNEKERGVVQELLSHYLDKLGNKNAASERQNNLENEDLEPSPGDNANMCCGEHVREPNADVISFSESVFSVNAPGTSS